MKRLLKIHNTSRYPDAEIARLVKFAYDSISREHPLGRVSVSVTNCRSVFRGRAMYGTFSSRILVRIGAPNKFPFTGQYRKRAAQYHFKDYRESVVSITAHELAHIEQYQRKLGVDEVSCEGVAAIVLGEFRAQRERVDDQIAEAVSTEQIRSLYYVRDRIEREALRRSPKAKLERLKKDESRWTRKLKLAQTKLQKLRLKKRRLERVMAGGSIGKMDAQAGHAPTAQNNCFVAFKQEVERCQSVTQRCSSSPRMN